jgi:ABC-type antimicrobial peptide transport system permease subunit
MAITAIILGTGLGIQGIASGQRLDELLMGIELTVRPPMGPISIGWACVVIVTVGAALPPAIAAARARPRELLASVKG